jgi:hypothetical protein
VTATDAAERIWGIDDIVRLLVERKIGRKATYRWGIPMYRVATISVVCAMVAACANQETKKKEDMAVLQGQPLTTSLQGQPVTAAIARLGLPTDDRTAAGHTVYIWSSSTIVEGAEHKCQIRAIMNGDVIGSFNYEGNSLACMRYTEMLK